MNFEKLLAHQVPDKFQNHLLPKAKFIFTLLLFLENYLMNNININDKTKKKYIINSKL